MSRITERIETTGPADTLVQPGLSMSRITERIETHRLEVERKDSCLSMSRITERIETRAQASELDAFGLSMSRITERIETRRQNRQEPQFLSEHEPHYGADWVMQGLQGMANSLRKSLFSFDG